MSVIQQQIREVRQALFLLGSDCRPTGDYSPGNDPAAVKIMEAIRSLDDQAIYNMIPRLLRLADKLKELR